MCPPLPSAPAADARNVASVSFPVTSTADRKPRVVRSVVAAAAPSGATARAENRRKGRLSAARAHTKAPYKTDSLWKILRTAEDRWTAPLRRGQTARRP